MSYVFEEPTFDIRSLGINKQNVQIKLRKRQQEKATRPVRAVLKILDRRTFCYTLAEINQIMDCLLSERDKYLATHPDEFINSSGVVSIEVYAAMERIKNYERIREQYDRLIYKLIGE